MTSIGIPLGFLFIPPLEDEPLHQSTSNTAEIKPKLFLVFSTRSSSVSLVDTLSQDEGNINKSFDISDEVSEVIVMLMCCSSLISP